MAKLNAKGCVLIGEQKKRRQIVRNWLPSMDFFLFDYLQKKGGNSSKI